MVLVATQKKLALSLDQIIEQGTATLPPEGRASANRNLRRGGSFGGGGLQQSSGGIYQNGGRGGGGMQVARRGGGGFVQKPAQRKVDGLIAGRRNGPHRGGGGRGGVQLTSEQRIQQCQDGAILETQLIYSPSGDLVVRLKETDVAKIKKDTGEMILDTGGWRTLSTRHVLSECLSPIGYKILVQENQMWQLSSNRNSILTFTDKMSLKHGHPAQLMARLSVVAQHLQQAKKAAEYRASDPEPPIISAQQVYLPRHGDPSTSRRVHPASLQVLPGSIAHHSVAGTAAHQQLTHQYTPIHHHPHATQHHHGTAYPPQHVVQGAPPPPQHLSAQQGAWQQQQPPPPFSAPQPQHSLLANGAPVAPVGGQYPRGRPYQQRRWTPRVRHRNVSLQNPPPAADAGHSPAAQPCSPTGAAEEQGSMIGCETAVSSSVTGDAVPEWHGGSGDVHDDGHERGGGEVAGLVGDGDDTHAGDTGGRFHDVPGGESAELCEYADNTAEVEDVAMTDG